LSFKQNLFDGKTRKLWSESKDFSFDLTQSTNTPVVKIHMPNVQKIDEKSRKAGRPSRVPKL